MMIWGHQGMAQIGSLDLSDHWARVGFKRNLLVETYAFVPWEECQRALERVWSKLMDVAVRSKELILSANNDQSE